MFLFKGNRDYLHSSDITNFICNNYSYNYLDIKFYKPLKTQPNFKLTKRIYNNHKANIVAKIKKNKVEKFLIFYDTDNEVKNRYPYDEELLNKFFKIGSDNVQCNLKTSINYIDLIVSMSTLWHLQKISKKKKWIVVRIKFNKTIVVKKLKNIFIKVVKIMNRKNTESEIFIDKKACGKIYYSAAKL
jgi:hypothetical protein